jgi:hypothetical protein
MANLALIQALPGLEPRDTILLPGLGAQFILANYWQINQSNCVKLYQLAWKNKNRSYNIFTRNPII